MAVNAVDYAGLYEVGSITAGDPSVMGRSDRDVAIVFTDKIPGPVERELRRQLHELKFNETYLFNLIRKARFLRTHNDHDIPMKFTSLA